MRKDVLNLRIFWSKSDRWFFHKGYWVYFGKNRSFVSRNQSRTLAFQKNLCHLLDWKPFKIDEKCFLFHLKSSFRSQDILVLVTTFWSCRKNGLIRKIMLTSKFMTPQPGLQAIAIHILPNISQSKGNQTMKFGQLIQYNKRNIFLWILCRKWGKETSSRPFFIF